MADWGNMSIKFYCNNDEFAYIYKVVFKEYNGITRLNFSNFIEDYSGDGSEYDSLFRFYYTYDESQEWRFNNHCFSLYCRSREMLQHIVICLSELLKCNYDASIYHPSYQSSIFYQIRNQRLHAEKEIVYYGQCGPDCCKLCNTNGVDEFGDIEWYCNEECVPWTFYDGDTGFDRLKTKIGYNKD